METWLTFALVVFAVTFVVNVAVTALWPDSGIDWAASAVIALSVTVALTVVERLRADD